MLIFLLLLLLPNVFFSANTPIIHTSTGPLIGSIFPNHAEYLGIPFAEPPVGELRFENPVPKSPWSPVLSATKWTAGCPYSEDCLTLNIFTPPNSNSKSSLPVLFFVPGGRFEQGSSGSALYQMENFVNVTNTIVVSTNYRLGVLGALTTKSISGNYAIKDQRVAMDWVLTNIHLFGGDPDHITLSGQSAGATSTAIHLASPDSWKYFKNAILESDPMGLPIKTQAQSQDMGKLITEYLNCTSPSEEEETKCLRAASIPAILEGQKKVGNHVFWLKPIDLFYPWPPHMSPDTCLDQPYKLLNSGKSKPETNIIIGDVFSETRIFIIQASPKPLPRDEYVAALALVFHLDAIEISEKYPLPSPQDSDARDHMCVVGKWAASGLLQHGKVWRYSFNHQLDQAKLVWGPNYTECMTPGVVCHGTELPFWINPPQSPWGSGEMSLVEQMQHYWGNFVKYGNPNGNSRTSSAPQNFISWPLFNMTSDMEIAFALPSTSVQNHVRSSYCDFWDRIGYSQP